MLLPTFFSFLADAGALDLIDDSDSDHELEKLKSGGRVADADLPGTGKKKKAIVRTRAVALAPTGRHWCAATTEGVLVYGLDQGVLFDPTDLEEDITPQAVARALLSGAFLRALLIALRLRDAALIDRCILSTPPADVAAVCQGVPPQVVPRLLAQVAELMAKSPHVEFLLGWVQRLGVQHGEALRSLPPGEVMPALRSLQKAVVGMHEDLQALCEANMYQLQFLSSVATAEKGDREGMLDGEDEGFDSME